jgi:hypothetical protein
MTTIVIPAADIAPGSEILLNNLLYSIYKQDIFESFKVLVCFDGCRDHFVEYFLDSYEFLIKDSKFINTKNRLNFAGNSNNGLRYVHQELKDNVLLVNQDCILPGVENLKKLSGKGIVSAGQVTYDWKDLDECIDTLNSMQNKELERQKHSKVTGFCMFLSKELMDKVGYIDEYFVAGFDDDDLCARASLAGFPIETVNVNVYHAISKCGAYENLAIPLNKMHIKWGIPFNVKHENFQDWIRDNYSWEDIEGMVCK